MIDRTDSTTPEPPGAGAAGRIRTWVHGPGGSADAERERARAADLARRPPDRRRVVKGEAGDALEPGFEGDPELHARQVRATQRWMPRPNAACRLTSRSMTTS